MKNNIDIFVDLEPNFIEALNMYHLESSDCDTSEHALLTWVHREVTNALPLLSHGRAYAFRTFFLEELFFQMERRQRPLAVKYLEYLIASGHVGLSIVCAEDGEEYMYTLK
jgi:hypothetical protein